MHGRTFNTLKSGETVTVWDSGSHHGRAGKVENTYGGHRAGKGRIVVKFEDGTRCDASYKHVAMGDNHDRTSA